MAIATLFIHGTLPVEVEYDLDTLEIKDVSIETRRGIKWLEMSEEDIKKLQYDNLRFLQECAAQHKIDELNYYKHSSND